MYCGYIEGQITDPSSTVSTVPPTTPSTDESWKQFFDEIMKLLKDNPEIKYANASKVIEDALRHSDCTNITCAESIAKKFASITIIIERSKK